MTSNQAVAQIKKGVEFWNAWRVESDVETPDLSHGSLRGLNLSGADLRGTDLRHADLRGAVLKGADLRGARLDKANLFKADLSDADLAGASLIGAQFLNCGQLVTARHWKDCYRDPELDCGAQIPIRGLGIE